MLLAAMMILGKNYYSWTSFMLGIQSSNNRYIITAIIILNLMKMIMRGIVIIMIIILVMVMIIHTIIIKSTIKQMLVKMKMAMMRTMTLIMMNNGESNFTSTTTMNNIRGTYLN